MTKTEINDFITVIKRHSENGETKMAWKFYKLMLIRIGEDELSRLYWKLHNKGIIARFQIELEHLALHENDQTNN